MIHVVAQDSENETQITGTLAVSREMLEHLRSQVARDPENKRAWIEDGVLRVERTDSRGVPEHAREKRR